MGDARICTMLDESVACRFLHICGYQFCVKVSALSTSADWLVCPPIKKNSSRDSPTKPYSLQTKLAARLLLALDFFRIASSVSTLVKSRDGKQVDIQLSSPVSILVSSLLQELSSASTKCLQTTPLLYRKLCASHCSSSD